jgi:hypothetical protein
MALSNIWGNLRRVIIDDLAVTYKKTLKTAVNSQNISRPYWRYERRRTMKFKYLGLTKSAAQACALAWNNALYAKVWRQVWIGNQSDPASNIGGQMGFWNSYHNPVDSDTADDRSYDYITRGTAAVNYDGGKGWTVTVNIDETLPYNHTPFDYGVSGNGTWEAFENDPQMLTTAFRYGSVNPNVYPERLAMDFSLDAAEWQLGLDGYEIISESLRPIIKFTWGCTGETVDRAVKDMRLWYRGEGQITWYNTGVDPTNGAFPAPDRAKPYEIRISYPLTSNVRGNDNRLIFSNVLEVK